MLATQAQSVAPEGAQEAGVRHAKNPQRGQKVFAGPRSIIDATRNALAVRPEDLDIGGLFERIRDAVVVADARTGCVVLWNPAAEEVFGYPPSEAIGMRVEDLVPGNLKDRHRAGMTRYGETGRGQHVDSRSLLELAAVKKGGEEIFVELSLNPIVPGNGAASTAGGEAERGRYVLAILRDVTRRKIAEDALKESEERTRGLADAAFEGLLITDEGEILEANRALFAMLGYAPDEAVGLSALEFVAPEHRDLVRRNISSGHEEPYEIVGMNKAGERVDLEVRGRAFSYRGRPVRVTALRDVTERKRAENEIRRLNEHLEEQVAERTASLVESRRRLKELVGKLIKAQEEERRRVAYEVHDGLTQVAIAAHQHLQAFADGHPPGSIVEEGDLDRVLSLAKRVVREARHVIEDLRPTALDDFGLAAALRLEAEEFTAGGWRVAYDEEDLGEDRLAPETETALYRVAQEALNNARKHAGVKEAHLKLARLPGKVRLEVRDEGYGFDPEGPPKNGGRGERVGLSGMRERMDLLGGELRITSAPGSGTAVVAEVPLSAEEAGAKAPRAEGR